jgi:hypothetical protein
MINIKTCVDLFPSEQFDPPASVSVYNGQFAKYLMRLNSVNILCHERSGVLTFTVYTE